MGDGPLRNGTNGQEGKSLPVLRRDASVGGGPVLALAADGEKRGNLDAVYAKPSVLRRPVSEGRRKGARAAPPD